MNTHFVTHPLLSDTAAIAWEGRTVGFSDAASLAAMRKAGAGLARALRRDLELLRAPSAAMPLNMLLLLGKGHNAGDALFALHALFKSGLPLRARAIFACGNDLRPNAKVALQTCLDAGIPLETAEWKNDRALLDGEWDLSLDGVFGLSFRPPVAPAVGKLFAAVNTHARIALRAAVDFPSGLCEATLHHKTAPVLRADITYQTGIPKKTVFADERAQDTGRLRYVDLGFFDADALPRQKERLVVEMPLLRALDTPRPALCDKRTFGHCIIASGSRGMAGAHLLNVKAALRSGAGLVTAFAPPENVAAFCACEPSAMWSAQRLGADGALAPDALEVFLNHLERIDAAMLGSGMGRMRATQAFLREVVRRASCALVLDADALFPEITETLFTHWEDTPPRILTPHAGEYERLNPEAANGDLFHFSERSGAIVVLKGPRTRICDGARLYYSIAGTPALARGGSGDVLAGLITGLLAQAPEAPLDAALAGAVWHGAAAEAMERARGQRACTTAELPDFLATALTESKYNCVN